MHIPAKKTIWQPIARLVTNSKPSIFFVVVHIFEIVHAFPQPEDWIGECCNILFQLLVFVGHGSSPRFLISNPLGYYVNGKHGPSKALSLQSHSDYWDLISSIAGNFLQKGVEKRDNFMEECSVSSHEHFFALLE
jgi:hypothetical protein